jgi:DNA-binding NarL/FixJ family response regulator
MKREENTVQSVTTPLRILVVDDHPAFRAGVVKLVSDDDRLKVVGETSSGQQAIRLTAELDADVVLLDVSLPDLNGVEVARRIVVATPKAKVLALSMHEDSAYMQALMDAGAVGYVCKRSACEQLRLAIRVVAAGGKHIDPHVARAPASGHSPATSSLFSPVILSEREAQVLRLVATGHPAKDIANQLQLSARTLETYKARGMNKLSLRTRADLVRFAVRNGWLHDS